MKGGGDDLTDISLFVTGLPTNSQHSLAEGRDAKDTILSGSKAQELQ